MKASHVPYRVSHIHQTEKEQQKAQERSMLYDPERGDQAHGQEDLVTQSSTLR